MRLDKDLELTKIIPDNYSLSISKVKEQPL